MSEQKFSETFTSYFEKLDLYTNAITRAHGASHPEAFEVRELFAAMSKKVNDLGNLDLKTEFTKLRQVTNNYSVPNDVCETYAATYEMLKQLDNAYEE